MSVVLICFPGAPKVSPEAVKKEADLDKYLEGRVEGTSDKRFSGSPQLTGEDVTGFVLHESYALFI